MSLLKKISSTVEDKPETVYPPVPALQPKTQLDRELLQAAGLDQFPNKALLFKWKAIRVKAIGGSERGTAWLHFLGAVCDEGVDDIKQTIHYLKGCKDTDVITWYREVKNIIKEEVIS